jgi:membrane protease YdiL (CAAX protease family)
MATAATKLDLSPSATTATSAVEYRRISRRPLVSLVFIAPMLLLYEVGVLALGGHATRNGADVWLRTTIEQLGIGQYFLLPVLVCGLLLAWHYLRRDPWTVPPRVLVCMAAEALMFALVLLLIARIQGVVFSKLHTAFAAEITLATGAPLGLFSHMIGYLGAGIYEELLFRLMLLPVAIAALIGCGVQPQTSVIVAVILTSLLFSAAHYRLDLWFGPWHLETAYGDVWGWYSFTFRSLAGVYFAVLFQTRGFGIAAGAHAFYDIAVALM